MGAKTLPEDVVFYGGSTLAIGLAIYPYGRVQSRINIAERPTRFSLSNGAGFAHVVDRHFTPGKNAGFFTITQEELKAILQRKEIISTPVEKIKETGNYSRLVNVNKEVGIVKPSIPTVGGQKTTYIRIITDEAGNLVTVYPAPKP